MGPTLSIIILNFNVKDLLINCLKSVYQNANDNWQVIVVDNASVDGSVEAVKKNFPQVELVVNKKNLGFAAGNNTAVDKVKAPVVLFLNPDTLVINDVIKKSYGYLIANPDIGALTCKVQLPDGKLDYSCHRGFPTPWNAFAYFSGLSKAFPKSPIFSGYSATYLDTDKSHEIDCISGSFLMVRKLAGDQIGWWDKDYFWNGEDIEFCFRLKQKGWKIYYFADAGIIHYKGSSAKEVKSETVTRGVSAMRIFYKKNYYKTYPPILRDFVLFGVDVLEFYRKLKVKLGLNYK